MSRWKILILAAALAACRPALKLGYEAGWTAPRLPAPAEVLPAPRTAAQTPPLRIRSGRGALRVDIVLPTEQRLKGPLRCRVTEKSGPIFFEDLERKFALARPRLPFLFSFRTEPGQSQLRLVVEFYHCRAGGRGPCYQQTIYQGFTLNAERTEPASVVDVRLRADR